jgi:pectate lyase
MAGFGSKIAFIFLVFAITIPCLDAGIAEFDDYLKGQAELAREIALKSYVPNPENITTDLNLHVHM